MSDQTEKRIIPASNEPSAVLARAFGECREGQIPRQLAAGYLNVPSGQTETDVDNIIAMLDGYARSGGSRLKIDVVDGQGEVLSRQYHHGRCDVGSPWACGTPFDVLEE